MTENAEGLLWLGLGLLFVAGVFLLVRMVSEHRNDDSESCTDWPGDE